MKCNLSYKIAFIVGHRWGRLLVITMKIKPKDIILESNQLTVVGSLLQKRPAILSKYMVCLHKYKLLLASVIIVLVVSIILSSTGIKDNALSLKP